MVDQYNILIKHVEDEIMGSQEDKSPDKPSWDSFKCTLEEENEFRRKSTANKPNKWNVLWMKTSKIIVNILIFIGVLFSGTISKITVLLMTSQIGSLKLENWSSKEENLNISISQDVKSLIGNLKTFLNKVILQTKNIINVLFFQ